MDVRATLVEAGAQLSDEMREGLLALGTEVVPALVAIFDDEELRDRDGPGEGWAPVHAAELLGELQDARAVEPLLRAVLAGRSETQIYNAAALALPRHGAAALEPILREHDAEHDPFERALLCFPLSELGVRDERIYERLLDCTCAHPDLGTSALGGYGDARAVPVLREMFDGWDAEDPRADSDVLIEVAGALTELGDELDDEQAKKLEVARDSRRQVRDAISRSGRFLVAPSRLRTLKLALGDSGRSLWNVRGHLCALATRPSPLQTSELVGVLPSGGVSQDSLNALMDLHNATVDALWVPPDSDDLGPTDPDDLCPNPRHEESIAEFCRGYVDAILEDETWPLDSENLGSVGPLMLLAGRVDLERADVPQLHEADFEIELREALPDFVAHLYAELAPLREAVARPQPAMSTKVGRNSPCPCGSGKKYKRCCGAA